MNPVFFFLSALLLLSSPAMATSWHTLTTNAQMTLEADEPQMEAADKKAGDKEKKKGKKLKIWDKITYSLPQQAKPGDFYYSSSKSMSEINCTTRTIRPLQRIYYNDDGRETKVMRYDDTEKAAIIVPDSPEEPVFDFACNFKPPKATTQAAPVKKPVPKAKSKASTTSKPASKTVKKDAPKKQVPKTATGTKPSAAK